MADISKIDNVEIANIAKINTVDVANIASIYGADVPPQTPASAWASWDETSEAGLASDDIYVAMMEGSSAGDNETGQGGGFTGSDLIMTQVNNIPGVSGGYRQLSSGSQHRFDWTAAAATTMIQNQEEWTVIVKVKDWATVATANNPIIRWGNSVSSHFFDLTALVGSKLRLAYKSMAAATVDTIPSTGVLYLCMWRKGGQVKAGFTTTTRPIVEADFATNKTVQSTDDSIFTNTLPTGYTLGSTARWPTIKVAYMVVSNTALFS